MPQTYKAVLKGNRLEWNGGGPERIDPAQELDVYVTILSDNGVASKTTSDGKAMAEALGKLASSCSVSAISDPSDWQRQQRQDRELPGRDGNDGRDL